MAPTSRGVTRKLTRHCMQSWVHPSRRKEGEKEEKRWGGTPGGRVQLMSMRLFVSIHVCV